MSALGSPLAARYKLSQRVYLTDVSESRYGEPAEVCGVEFTPLGTELYHYDIEFEDGHQLGRLRMDQISWKAPAA